jgi:prepilin-type N-terminal cleavage/methylation domain-containing protein
VRSKKGVTLIELLVAMGILAILITVLYSVFTVSLRAWKKANNIFESATIARVVLDRITTEIKNAVIKPGSNEFFCRGFDQSAQSGWRTNSKADEFYFIAAINKDEGDKSDLCEVGYWVDDQGTSSDSDDVLNRFYVTDGRKTGTPASFDFDFSTGSSNEFSPNVTDLQFVYYNSSGSTSNSWDSSSMGAPSKIDISITVQIGAGSQTTNPDFSQKTYTATVSFLNN